MRSNWCSLTAGVPQGAMLCPIFLSIFNGEITYSIFSSFHLYDLYDIHLSITFKYIVQPVLSSNLF